jgi:ABC-type branched-subunit amino acid transport system permease subunit
VYRPSVKQLSISASVLLALLFPQLGLKSYYLHIAILALINILLSLGLNVIAGYAGQLSLAQAAFFGIGSYTSARAGILAGGGSGHFVGHAGRRSFWLADASFEGAIFRHSHVGFR